MPEQPFYLRRRGQISGPYSQEELRILCAQGQVQPLDDLSQDQTHWLKASSLTGLFPPTAGHIPVPARRSNTRLAIGCLITIVLYILVSLASVAFMGVRNCSVFSRTGELPTNPVK
jgi:hypothetical protein